MKKKRTPAGRPESLRRAPSRSKRKPARAGGSAPVATPRKPARSSGASRASGEDQDGEDDGRVRLNRYLALNGIASRRRADELIRAGEVLVDDEIVTELGTRIDPVRQRVEVDGVVLKPEGERKRYYLLNKPKGVVCTNDRRESRKRAIDLVTDRQKGRIYTVGRLDEETTGLVLLTNDGEFAQRIGHPRYGVSKVYEVVVVGRVSDEQLEKLRTGVRLSDFRSDFERVWLKKRSEHRSTLLVTLGVGRNREIRRVFAKLGLPVRSLQRVQIGDLADRRLRVGYWRPLTRAEVSELVEAADPDRAPPRRRGQRGQQERRGPRGQGARGRSTKGGRSRRD